MSDKLEGMPSTQRIVDPETGIIDPEWYDFFEELVFGNSSKSVGTILSGFNGLVAGTKPVTDVLIDGRGSLNAIQDVQDTNITNAATSSGSFAATVDPTYATDVNGSKTSVTVTPSGGTAPYSYSYSVSSFTADSPTAATTTFTYTGPTLGADGSATETCTCTVTDDNSDTTTVTFSVSKQNVSGI